MLGSFEREFVNVQDGIFFKEFLRVTLTKRFQTSTLISYPKSLKRDTFQSSDLLGPKGALF